MSEKTNNQYTNYKDSYTYRQILIGLRNEFLEFQKELDQLSEYNLTNKTAKKDEYYFNLYQNNLENKNPELVLDRVMLKKGLLEKLRNAPTRAIMVKNNNDVYYPLRKNWYKKDEFNITIKPGCEKEFQECVEEILNSNVAKYMMQLNGNIPSITSMPVVSKKTPIIKPNISSFGFELCTSKSNIKYLGRNNIIEFRSVRMPNEKWEPLTQEYLDYVSELRFLKDNFSEYHRNIIDKTIEDNRPIILSEDYQPKISEMFEVQDTPKQIVLTKTKSKRKL